MLEVGEDESDGVREGVGFVTDRKLYWNQEDCKVVDWDNASIV
jgi:hypothetical protein